MIEPHARHVRLIARRRASFAKDLLGYAAFRFLVDPISFVMERKMLLGIKRRPEAATSVAVSREDAAPLAAS